MTGMTIGLTHVQLFMNGLIDESGSERDLVRLKRGVIRIYTNRSVDQVNSAFGIPLVEVECLQGTKIELKHR